MFFRATATSGAEASWSQDAPDTGRLELTAVIPTFNSAEHIAACLSSIYRCLPDTEVIVVDNGSTDATCDIVVQRFPMVRVVSGHGNVGFGQACNLGAGLSSKQYLLYLNPDAELVSADRPALFNLVRARPLGMVGVTLMERSETPHPSVRRRYKYWLSEFAALQVLAILSRLAPKPRYVERAHTNGIYMVSGAACLVAVDEFLALGGFDKRFFMYYEDTDLSRKYRQLGYPLSSTGALLARHVGGASTTSSYGLALSFLGWLEYVNKWHGEREAKRAAALALAVYATVVHLLHIAALATRSRHFEDKAEQIGTMLRYIARGGDFNRSSASQSLYPAASPLARRVFRRFAPSDAGAHKAPNLEDS
jgi:GT2 family glycosyltransferase